MPLLEAAQQQWEADVVNYDVTLPELAPDAKASPADKKLAEQVTELLKKEAAARNANEKQQIQTYFRGKATKLFRPSATMSPMPSEQRKSFYDPCPNAWSASAAPTSGSCASCRAATGWTKAARSMKPALPHFLPQPKIEGRDLNRLDLAQWLVARDNPLTARTVMNRLWKQLFGAGLSKMLDDLGAQGEPPANPALLDWLACEFMDSGWDMKHMVRTIVTSAAYKQVSTATPGNAGRRSLQSRIRAAKRLPDRCGAGARQRAGDFRAAVGARSAAQA